MKYFEIGLTCNQDVIVYAKNENAAKNKFYKKFSGFGYPKEAKEIPNFDEYALYNGVCYNDIIR